MLYKINSLINNVSRLLFKYYNYYNCARNNKVNVHCNYLNIILNLLSQINYLKYLDYKNALQINYVLNSTLPADVSTFSFIALYQVLNFVCFNKSLKAEHPSILFKIPYTARSERSGS